jgi:hypothetical protein
MKAIRRIKKAQDGATTTPKKTWQQMTAGEKGAKKVELIKQGGMELFKKYKDSISTDATNRREAEINKAAASRGMSRDEYAKWYKSNKNKPDVGIETCGPNFKSTKCGVSKAASKESKSDWGKKKNGGKITKAKDGKWMQKASASIKRRGTKGVCTGAKFGGPTCKPGSKRYTLAKTFKKIAKSNKKK